MGNKGTLDELQAAWDAARAAVAALENEDKQIAGRLWTATQAGDFDTLNAIEQARLSLPTRLYLAQVHEVRCELAVIEARRPAQRAEFEATSKAATTARETARTADKVATQAEREAQLVQSELRNDRARAGELERKLEELAATQQRRLRTSLAPVVHNLIGQKF
jgi:chromosome segregation ATPase